MSGGWWQVFRWRRLRAIWEGREQARLRREEDESERWAPARDAYEQLHKDLSGLMRYAQGPGTMRSDNRGRLGFVNLTVFGKRVPEDISAEDALKLMEARA